MTDKYKYLQTCTAMGPVFLTAFIVFWGILGFNIPPLAADLPANEMGAIYRDNQAMIRLGMVVAMTCAVLYMVWGLSMAKVIEYGIEKENNVMSTLALWGAGLTVVPLLVSCSFWLTAAYRPDMWSDVQIVMLYDQGWLLIDLAYSVTSLQLFAIGIGFLQDQRADRLVPKWLAWYGIWVGFMFIAECLMPYFKSDAFARHGILNFWIEFFIWFFWIVAISAYTFRAIARLKREAGLTSTHAPSAGQAQWTPAE